MASNLLAMASTYLIAMASNNPLFLTTRPVESTQAHVSHETRSSNTCGKEMEASLGVLKKRLNPRRTPKKSGESSLVTSTKDGSTWRPKQKEHRKHLDSLKVTWKWKMAPWKTIFLYKHGVLYVFSDFRCLVLYPFSSTS